MSAGRGSYRVRQRIRKKLEAVEHECWLCLEPLHFDIADARNPKFVVIDEYIPVSKGGDPLDINNCHLVCRCCNARKGNRILKKGCFAAAAQRNKNLKPNPSRKWLK